MPRLQRPPWAVAEADFLRACTHCGDCELVCETRIVVMQDGYPQIDFAKGACTFCGDCVKACVAGALRREDAAALPWKLRAQVAATCLATKGVECRVCGEHCEVAAIRFSPRLGGPPLPEILNADCTGCGACVAPCPAAAIRIA